MSCSVAALLQGGESIYYQCKTAAFIRADKHKWRQNQQKHSSTAVTQRSWPSLQRHLSPQQTTNHQSMKLHVKSSVTNKQQTQRRPEQHTRWPEKRRCIQDWTTGDGCSQTLLAQYVSEQCFTSLPTQYRLYGRRFLQVRRPNQQYQSTEGDATKEKENNENN